MIALDTNLLVYAHRLDTAEYSTAHSVLVTALGPVKERVAIAGPCVGEFLAAVTSPGLAADPTPMSRAVAQMDAWLSAPNVSLIGERSGTWPLLRGLIERSGVTGQRVHDARIAAICVDHGVRELWTVDRDFGRFPELRTRNPLVAPPAG